MEASILFDVTTLKKFTNVKSTTSRCYLFYKVALMNVDLN